MSNHGVAAARLWDRLERSAEEAGCNLTWVAEVSRPYQAVMFTGGHHRLTVSVGGSAGQDWLEQLDEHSIMVPSFVVMQLEVGAVEPKGGRLIAELEVITVREA